MLWTPYEIEIIIHHHISYGEFPRHDAPLYPDIVSRLAEMGILEPTKEAYVTTEMGKALVEMWCSTPEPKKIEKYVDPRFE